jgi:hypothetical protein
MMVNVGVNYRKYTLIQFLKEISQINPIRIPQLKL